MYQTTTPNPKGSPFKAFYAEIDATDDNIRFKAALATGTSLTPQAFSTREEDEVYVAINAGFFGGNVSYSLVMEEGKSLYQISGLSRPYNGGSHNIILLVVHLASLAMVSQM